MKFVKKVKARVAVSITLLLCIFVVSLSVFMGPSVVLRELQRFEGRIYVESNTPEFAQDWLSGPLFVKTGYIKEIHINHPYFTDDDLGELVKNIDITQLDVVELSGTQISDAGIRRLADAKNLKWIQISHTQVSNDGIEFLGALPNLERIIAIGTNADEQFLVSFSSVKPKISIQYHSFDSMFASTHFPPWALERHFSQTTQRNWYPQ